MALESRDLEHEIAELRESICRMQRQLTRVARDVRDQQSSGLTDEQYAGFEDAFRGPFDEIVRRLGIYLPFVNRTVASIGSRRLLDLGCGRGEWLELLRREGYDALGVDVRPNAVARCRDDGLWAIAGDALSFVRRQPADAWTVVSAFHLVEHLPTGRLMQMFGELFRILEPGGTLLVETPNLSNVLVGSCYFHLDPTHQRPLPPEMWHYLLCAAGFVHVDIWPVNPSPSELAVSGTGSPLEDRFNDLFYGPRDIGLIATKAAAFRPAAVE